MQLCTGADESGEDREAKVKNAAEALWKLPEATAIGKIMGDAGRHSTAWECKSPDRPAITRLE